MNSKKKSYKWIVTLAVVVVICAVGGYIRDKFGVATTLKDFTPVDVENADVEEMIEKADEGREKNIVKLDINAATMEELCELEGIGETTAAKIIKYRDDYGALNRIEEIMSIPGIGEKTFDAIKEYITVEQNGE